MSCAAMRAPGNSWQRIGDCVLSPDYAEGWIRISGKGIRLSRDSERWIETTLWERQDVEGGILPRHSRITGDLPGVAVGLCLLASYTAFAQDPEATPAERVASDSGTLQSAGVGAPVTSTP